MPIYEYVCKDCQTKFELIRPISKSDEAATCPECNNSAERVLSLFACFSSDANGIPYSVGGSSCSGCSSDSCATCNN